MDVAPLLQQLEKKRSELLKVQADIKVLEQQIQSKKKCKRSESYVEEEAPTKKPCTAFPLWGQPEDEEAEGVGSDDSDEDEDKEDTEKNNEKEDTAQVVMSIWDLHRRLAISRLKSPYLASCCTIQRSALHGVGVVTLVPLPIGSRPLLLGPPPINWGGEESRLSGGNSESVALPVAELEELKLPTKMLECLKSRFIFDKKMWSVPVGGLNVISLPEFMNHSDTPNLQVLRQNEDQTEDEGEDTEDVVYECIRDVEEGEELTVDYRQAFRSTNYYYEQIGKYLEKREITQE